MELELLYLWQQNDVFGRAPARSSGQVTANPRRSIRKALRRAGAQVYPISNVVPGYDKWSVVDDSTIQLNDWDRMRRSTDCRVDGAEVISRVLRYDDATWIGEVDQVLGALNGLNKPSGRRRVLPNLNCGFHVHVGQGEAGYTLAQMKRVFMMATAFERHLDQLQGVSRIQPGCYSIGPAAANTERLRTARKTACWLRAIGRFQVSDFPEKFCTYNFWSCGYEDRYLHTIEFRQHRGTLNPEEAKAWIDVVASLVRYAVDQTEDEILSFCLDCTSDPEFTVHELLDEIDVPLMSRVFYRHRLNGDVSWLLRHKVVGHRSDGFIIPVTDLSDYIDDQLDGDVKMEHVTEAVVSKYARNGYGQLDADLTRRICDNVKGEIQAGECQDVEMVDAV